jgi:predicted secreted protein
MSHGIFRPGKYGRVLRISLLLFACGMVSVEAGTVYSADVIGFSTDAQYMAYTVSAVEDMSGFTTARLFILDVPGNEFVFYGEEHSFRGDNWIKPEEAVARLLERHQERLASYDIDQQEKGKVIFKVEEGKISTDISRPQETEFEISRFGPLRERYTLTIDVRAVKSRECERYIDSQEVKIFTLRLLGPRPGMSTVLQKDRVLYDSRGCPLDYALSQVRYYRGHLVVFLNSFTFDIEGPDARKLVVSGPLPR